MAAITQRIKKAIASAVEQGLFQKSDSKILLDYIQTDEISLPRNLIAGEAQNEFLQFWVMQYRISDPGVENFLEGVPQTDLDNTASLLSKTNQIEVGMFDFTPIVQY